MSTVRVEMGENQEPEDVPVDDHKGDKGEEKARARTAAPVEVEIEREITKRKMIESITQIVVVILYMAFTLLRDRDSGVVVLDEDEGSSDDWKE